MAHPVALYWFVIFAFWTNFSLYSQLLTELSSSSPRYYDRVWFKSAENILHRINDFQQWLRSHLLSMKVFPKCLSYLWFIFILHRASRKTCPRLKRIHPRFLYPFRPNCLVPSVRPASSVRLSPPLASFSEKRRLEDRWRRDRTFFCHGEVQKCRLIGGERSRSFCQYLFWSWLNQEFSYLYLYFYDCI